MSSVYLVLVLMVGLSASGLVGAVYGALSFNIDLELGAEGEEYFFGEVTSVAEDLEGNIYVADQQQNCVLKFSAEGDFKGTLGQAGTGPGTIMPRFYLATGPNDEIYITGVGGRIEVVDTEWGYLRSYQRENPASMPRGIAIYPSGGFAIAVPGQATSTTVDVYDPNGAYAVSLSQAFSFNKGYPRHMERPFVGGSIAIGSSGTLYYAQMNPYLIRAFDSAGAKVDSTNTGGADFVEYPIEPEIRGDSVTYRSSSHTNGIVVLESGVVLVSSWQVESREKGVALFCAYDEKLEFQGSVVDSTMSRLAGVGTGNMAYLSSRGEMGTRVLRAAFTVDDP